MPAARRLLEQLMEDYGPKAARYVREMLGAEETKPKYKVRQAKTGPVIKREGAKPQRVPAARDAKTIDDLRVLIRDPKTNPALRAANAESMRVRGRPLSPDEPLPKSSLRRQSGIGRVYQEAAEGSPAYKHAIYEAYGNAMPDVVEQSGAQNYDQLTEAAYRSLGEDTKHQFSILPLTMRYHSGEGEYDKPSDMFRDVLANGRLNVFSGGDPHEFLSEIDPDTGLSLNEMFRANHDFIGHVAPGSTFRAPGEEIAYAYHQRTLPPLSQMALLSETRGQNSLVNYSPLNADIIHKQRALRAEMEQTRNLQRMRGQGSTLDPKYVASVNAQLRDLATQYQYGPQKALLLPPEYLDPMTEGGVPEYLKGIITPRAGSDPERAIHLSHSPGLDRTDPAMYGTGHQGVDWTSGEHSGIGRTHFYLGPEGTVYPEKVVADVSPHVYEARVKDLYDIGADPEGLVSLARAYNLPEFKGTPQGRSAIPDFERLLEEYGYAGMLDKHAAGRSAKVFEPVDLQFRPGFKAPPYAEGGRV